MYQSLLTVFTVSKNRTQKTYNQQHLKFVHQRPEYYTPSIDVALKFLDSYNDDSGCQDMSQMSPKKVSLMNYNQLDNYV